jgi:peptide/nickel transport system permease protein
MFSYLIRRLLYVVPIIFGVMLLTFTLFFVVESPEAMAKSVLGRRANQQSVQVWLHNRGYDKPLFFNGQAGHRFYDSIFFNKMADLARFRLGRSDVTGRELKEVFLAGAVPSVLITMPAFFVGLFLAVGLALYLVFVRDSPLDTAGALFCVGLMSIPPMVYIIFGQGFIALVFNYFPAFGFDLHGFSTIKFLLLPVALMVVIGLGYDVRLYRAIFLEEASQDYVRTGMAKGLPVGRLYGVHVLKNGLIAIITLTVAHLPTLILGSLLMENFFGIPGLGNSLYLAIQTSDFATLQAFVFLSGLLIQAGLIATDFCYALVDPRIRLS